MSQVTIKQGNTAILETLVKDADGEVVTTLSSATEILFEVVKDGTVKISKSLTDGIEVDTPSEGYVRITLKPADTKDLPSGTYLMGVQIVWDANTIYEIDLAFEGKQTVFLQIAQDVVE